MKQTSNVCVITYYKNRKLYFRDASRFVNLSECKQLMDSGYHLKFIEHSTGEDVTERCLKEMLCKITVSKTKLIDMLNSYKVSSEKEM